MKVRSFPVLADQNVNAAAVEFLREKGFDVRTVEEAGLATGSDETILATATVEGRIVLTHDADFGALALQAGMPYIGIVYLRPGHIDPTANLDSLQQLLDLNPDLAPPFIVVVKRTITAVTIRIR